jgi:hypothetical protein
MLIIVATSFIGIKLVMCFGRQRQQPQTAEAVQLTTSGDNDNDTFKIIGEDQISNSITVSAISIKDNQ